MKDYNTIESILRKRVIIDAKGCWIYTGSLNVGGYGVTAWQGKARLVHRVIYAAIFGPIPDEWHVDHLCRVRSCCNPLHLEAVTAAENARRVSRGIDLSGFCRKGLHDVTIPGALVVSSRGRECRQCRNAVKRASYARSKQRNATERTPA